MRPSVSRLKNEIRERSAFEWLKFLCCFIDDVPATDRSMDRQQHVEMQHLCKTRDRSDNHSDVPNFNHITQDIPPVGRLARPTTLKNNPNSDDPSHQIKARDIHCPLSDGGCGMVYWYPISKMNHIVEHINGSSEPVVTGLTVQCPCGITITVSEGPLSCIDIVPESNNLEQTIGTIRHLKQKAEQRLTFVDKHTNTTASNPGHGLVYVDKHAKQLLVNRLKYLILKEYELMGLLASATEKMYNRQHRSQNKKTNDDDETKDEVKRPDSQSNPSQTRSHSPSLPPRRHTRRQKQRNKNKKPRNPNQHNLNHDEATKADETRLRSNSSNASQYEQKK